MATFTRTVIKIGDSLGVTLPAKELKRLGIKVGDDIHISFDLARNDRYASDAEVLRIAQDLLKRHERAFKNLTDR